MLSLRLKEIANLVPNNSSIINVGTDHALLEIHLAKLKNVKCLGIDINEHSINKSLKNVVNNNFQDKITIKKNNGLKGIKVTNEIIVISGLGSRTILDILKPVTDNELIIQSNNDLFNLRKKICKKGYYVFDEKVVYDGKWYVVIYFKKGKKKYSEFKLYLGPKVKTQEYINYLLNINEKKFRNIPKSKIIKRLKTKILIIKLKNCI